MTLSITNTDKEYLWSAETTTCQHSSTSSRQSHPSTSLIINYKQLWHSSILPGKQMHNCFISSQHGCLLIGEIMYHTNISSLYCPRQLVLGQIHYSDQFFIL